MIRERHARGETKLMRASTGGGRTAAGHGSWLGRGLVIVVAAASLCAGTAGANPHVPFSTRGTAESPVQAIAVFGPDGRRRLDKGHGPLAGKIGLLTDRRTRQVCTAFCLGERTIATAAHCIYGVKGDAPPKLSDFTFRLAHASHRQQTRIAGTRTRAAEQFVAAGTTSLSIRPPIDATSDWALVRLAAPVCKTGGLALSRLTPAELTRPGASAKVYHVAFHRDFPSWRLAIDRTCAIRRSSGQADRARIAQDFARPERLILHTCDTGGASSGSPLLVDGPSGPEVVGINVGTYVQSRVLLQRGEIIHRYRTESVANTAVSTAAFRESLAEFEQADIIADSRQMQELQRRLGERGLLRSKADGIYGKDSRDAIERFEKEEGRPVTGLATQSLLRRLKQLSAEAAGAPPPTTSLDGLETGTLGRMKPAKGQPSSP